MQELQHDFEEQGFEVEGVNLTAAAAAAAVLLDVGAAAEEEDVAEDEQDCAGSLVYTHFQFTTKQEWLVPGMRFVVRDQRGHVSGVGVVCAVGQ
jgi:hypothetical protein